MSKELDDLSIGDIIRIRDDLDILINYGHDVFVSSMTSFLGKEATITSCLYGKYKIDLDYGAYNWTPEMIKEYIGPSLNFAMKKISTIIIEKERGCETCEAIAECESFKKEYDNSICGAIDLINNLINKK